MWLTKQLPIFLGSVFVSSPKASLVVERPDDQNSEAAPIRPETSANWVRLPIT